MSDNYSIGVPEYDGEPQRAHRLWRLTKGRKEAVCELLEILGSARDGTKPSFGDVARELFGRLLLCCGPHRAPPSRRPTAMPTAYIARFIESSSRSWWSLRFGFCCAVMLLQRLPLAAGVLDHFPVAKRVR